MDKNENAEERVTDGDSVRKGRIDLTQFEGTIAEGKWHEHIYEPKEDGYERVASIVVVVFVAPPYTLQTNEGHTFATVEMGDLTAHLPLFMMVPKLIAELKRTYDKIDVLEERLQFSEHIMETMHDEHYADLVMDFIEQAHPSKWCDWGHCRECQRSKKKPHNEADKWKREEQKCSSLFLFHP